jgi:hypothetical protein
VAARLAREPGVRAVVALLGDLTSLRGNDPSIKAYDTGALTSRTPRVPEVIAARDALAAAASRAGAAFLAAIAPLGRPTRIEVPELLVVADALRAVGPVLDLQAAFQSLEEGPLFENSFDRLDDWGHDALARALLPALLEALPPRDAEERCARLIDRALTAFAQDRAEELTALVPQVETSAPRGARLVARRAALLSALQGLQARAADWDALAATSEPDVPGLLLARMLTGRPHGSLAPADEGEMSLATVAAGAADGRPDVSALALQTVNSLPERVEAWLVLQLACDTVGPRRDWRELARRNLKLFDRGPVALALAERLLDAQPAARDALPAVVCVRRQWLATLPDGPVLREARRRAAVGYVEVASDKLKRAAAGVSERIPPRWRELIDAWSAPR